eukprot:TRINITY_DN3174_c0_g1_i1.p1 TRINITY_DN3174_c0_g1~~TRINITY_DN3174_c0_g1_i1.p1  ORF type:complete len:1478 (-),score=496.95 TRINITY_DN3174_c0_g1_i1:150-4583(-)
MGEITFLQNSLTSDEVRKIFELGPNMHTLPNTENSDIVTGPKGNLYYVDKKAVAKAFLTYDPKAIEGMLCMDTSSGDTRHYGTKMEGVKEWNTKGFSDTVQSIGGLKNLVTLLTRFEDGKELPLQQSQDPGVVFQLYLQVAIHSSAIFEEQMLGCSGMQVSGLLLEQISDFSPDCLTIDTVTKLEQLVSYIHQIYGSNVLFLQLVKNILLNFRIWMYTEVNVQLKLFQAISTFVFSMPQFFRQQIRVIAFIDALRYFYWLEPIRNKKILVEEEYIERRLPNAQVLEIRSKIIKIMSGMMENNMTIEEAHAFVGYIRDFVAEPEQLQDILDSFSGSLLNFLGKKIDQPNVRIPPKYYADLWDATLFLDKQAFFPLPSLPKMLALNAPIVEKKWRKLVRALERESNGQDNFWKLDLTENSKRMRRRLVKYHHPLRQHLGCAKKPNYDDKDKPAENPNALTEESFVVVDKDSQASETPKRTPLSPIVPRPQAEIIPGGNLELAPGVSITTENLQPDEVFREGFLRKQGRKKKNWSTRYFQLEQSILFYRMEGTTKNSISLEGATIQKNEEKYSTDYCFEIVSKDRTYALAAHNRWEMQQWFQAIKRAIPNTTTKMVLSPTSPGAAEPSGSLSPTQSRQEREVNAPKGDEHDDNMIFDISLIYSTELIYKSSCQLVQGLDVIPGIFEISQDYLHFFAVHRKKGQKVHTQKTYWKWHIDLVRDIYRRTFILRHSALEIFLSDRTSVFLNFPGDEVTKALSKIIGLRPQAITNYANVNADKLVSKLKLTKQWRDREISNFQYLMMLNTISGRTFNDLNQYPVFPWVLQDYTSSSLDLNNPAIYRDLTKPIGALNESRLQGFVERYQNFDDPNIPKFHYGTHYSNAGGVLFYLMRTEQFTSYFAQLGDGKFDHPERQFASLEKTWNGCLTNNNNVKELTPEFYYFPEFLVNTNNIDFGSTRVEGKISNVILPPWADSPDNFIRLNRAALESEYVSAHLDEWIDLIWGYKQQGPEAEKACNVFFYLTYPDQIDLDAIEDPIEKTSIEAQVLNFGQCPNVLFFKKHPKRLTLAESQRRERASIMRSLTAAFSTMSESLSEGLNLPNLVQGLRGSTANPTIPEEGEEPPKEIEDEDDDVEQIVPIPEVITPRSLETTKGSVKAARFQMLKEDKQCPVVSILCFKANVMLIYRNGTVAMNSFVPTEKEIPFTFIMDRTIQSGRPKQIDWLVSSTQITNPTNCFCIAGSEGNNLISCGNWDNSFRVTVIPRNSDNKLQNRHFFHEHRDIVGCLANDGDYLVTASFDGLIKLWEVSPFAENLTKPYTIKLKHRLFGHLEKITCLDINRDEDLIVSGSVDRTCKLFSISRGSYVRTIPLGEVPEMVKISPEGHIVILSHTTLSVFTFNGKLLATTLSKRRICDVKVSKNGKFITAGGEGGQILIMELHSLKILKSFELPNIIRAISYSVDSQFIFAGLENGDLWVVPFDSS